MATPPEKPAPLFDPPYTPRFAAIEAAEARGHILAQVEPALVDVQRERDRQDAKWGPAEDQPDGLTTAWRDFGAHIEMTARYNMDVSHQRGASSSYADIFMEEVGEALQTRTPEHLREELVQVAAVCSKWITILDRRASLRKEIEKEVETASYFDRRKS